ncbi:hypothetical protein HRG_003592 [Hirsutella rhossiliensis]|uniref:Uncharacterized protein n=1 Tax=Hirsutella rhossiliensis TaxID=111463 RepID=A0A9P8N427_9HYPO|nr:uncharacterized protein HRG_03592 [Hirsutella rhossiliensis]KAH0965576.1 hypothetical protein HRG_03592 [Hirsutella rhossiliensis]
MKISALLTGAFAALAVAVPAPAPAPVPNSSSSGALEGRGAFNAKPFNNLVFNQRDLNYLLKVNSLNLQTFQGLAINNGLNVGAFQTLFAGNVFDVRALLQFQQLQTLLAVANVGVFNGVDLSRAAFNVIELGALGGVGGVAAWR